MLQLPYILFIVLGICVGSFLNVCIYRIPRKENIVFGSSHCTSCNHDLHWYELIPIISYIALRGKCVKCKSRISLQYPLIEAANGFLWTIVIVHFGISIDALLGAMLASALLTLAIIDAKTKEIPFGINCFIGILAITHLLIHHEQYSSYLWGMVVISALLFVLFYLSNGTAIGGGDVKLMAVSGLYFGLVPIVFAFILACCLASIIHVIRMKYCNASRELALGPYLASSLFITLIWGNYIITSYISLF